MSNEHSSASDSEPDSPESAGSSRVARGAADPFSFYVGADLVPPVITHDPLGNNPPEAFPLTAMAVVTVRALK